MPTFRELLIEFNTRRNQGLEDLPFNNSWAIQSILERLANWEEFRNNHPKPEPEPSPEQRAAFYGEIRKPE